MSTFRRRFSIPNLFVVNADGSDLTKVSNDSLSVDAFSWSKDETRLAFGAERNGNREIFVVDVDGKNLRNITNHPAKDFHFAWVYPGQADQLISGAALSETDLLAAGVKESLWFNKAGAAHR